MYDVLKVIRFEKVITTSIISSKVDVNRVSVANNLNRLVKVGILNRVDCYHYQGRSCFYEFTPVGIALYDKLYGDDE